LNEEGAGRMRVIKQSSMAILFYLSSFLFFAIGLQILEYTTRPDEKVPQQCFDEIMTWYASYEVFCAITSVIIYICVKILISQGE
jgi:hypothetical protein